MRATLRTAAIAVAAGAVLTLQACGGGDDRTQADLVSEGREQFESSCAACHGLELEGTDDGPSFLDRIYAPNHHPDEAFYQAAENGVQQHHGTSVRCLHSRGSVATT